MKIFLLASSAAVFCLLLNLNVYTQGVAINNTGTSNDPSAILDVNCSNQGVLLPRMTEAQRDAIKSPAEGLVLYNLTTNTFNFFNASDWIEMQSTFVTASSGAISPGNKIAISTTGASPHNSAILDISSTTKGVLLPRATTASVTSPANGLIIYNSTTKRVSHFNGSSWDSPCTLSVAGSSASGSSDVDGVAINASGAEAHHSAILDMSSSEKGFLLPRLTSTERNDLLPTAGLLIYNTDTNSPEYWNGSGWYSLSASGDGFITEWRTNTPNESITLPLNNGNASSFNCTVYWGDGSQSSITAYDDLDRTHSYVDAGDYEVEIIGTCEGWSFDNAGDKLKIIDIISWGDLCAFDGFKYLENGFYGCSNLTSLASGSIPASGTGCSTFSDTFNDCVSISSIPVDLFDQNTLVSEYGFYRTFFNCNSLTSIPSGLFDNNTLVSVSGFYSTFSGCSSVTSIPFDLFDNNTLVSEYGFYRTFFNCNSLTSIPSGLFDNNTLVSEYGFYRTFAGCSSVASIPIGLFDNNTLVSSAGFLGTFSGCLSLSSIPAGLFNHNTLVSNSGFSNTFEGCSSITSIPAGLFDQNILVSNIGFANTFGGCSSITSIPAGLFDHNTLVASTGFYATFNHCTSLSSIPSGLFDHNTQVSNNGFYQTFSGCSSLSNIPVGLFDYNTQVSSCGFFETFSHCSSLNAIPADLFNNNLQVSENGFFSTFSYCNSIISIPVGLFDHNSLVSEDGFYGTFSYCTNLETVPAELFRFNTLVTGEGFERTFFDCNKLQQNRNIFFADGEENTRFLNTTLSFEDCFPRDSFTGTMGEAPPLWNCAFGAGSESTGCFGGAGNCTTSLNNYDSIPAEWK